MNGFLNKKILTEDGLGLMALRVCLKFKVPFVKALKLEQCFQA